MIALEQLADGSVSDRNFQKLMSLVIDTGAQSLGIRVGTGTATWTAATVSATKVITHGLGRTPVVAAAFQSGTSALLYGTSAIGATTFTVTGFYTDHATFGNLTGTFSFMWVAIG